MISLLGMSIIAGLSGCDRNSKALVPQPSDAFPGVIEAGQLAVLPKEAFTIYARQDEKRIRGFDDSSECLPVLEGGADCSDVTPPNELPKVSDVPQIRRGACDASVMMDTIEAYFDDIREWELADDPETMVDMPAHEFMGLIMDRLHDRDGRQLQPCYFGELGQAGVETQGGATYTFNAPVDADSGEVCLMVDPETVFWAESISPVARDDEFGYPDYYDDDGDIDMFAGLSSYYNGSPGQELGDFTGFYTDSLGTTVEIEYGECFQTGFPSGMNTAHAGRGTTEYCGIIVEQRPNIEYTVVLETFNVPLDDGVLSFGAAAVGGRCLRMGPNECTFRDESQRVDGDKLSKRECVDKLEDAVCSNKRSSFCCANPDMCGDHPPDDLCDDTIYKVNEENIVGSGNARDKWCCTTDLCCDLPATDKTGVMTEECGGILAE
jgi:hypothetical protein